MRDNTIQFITLDLDLITCRLEQIHLINRNCKETLIVCVNSTEYRIGDDTYNRILGILVNSL